MSRVSNIIHSLIHFPANYPVVNLVVWHLAELEHLAMTISRGCPGRRDYSIKEECVNHMWQDLKKGVDTGRHQDSHIREQHMGASQGTLHMCFPWLPARTDKEKNKYVLIPPSLLEAQVLEPRKVMRKWVFHSVDLAQLAFRSVDEENIKSFER